MTVLWSDFPLEIGEIEERLKEFILQLLLIFELLKEIK